MRRSIVVMAIDRKGTMGLVRQFPPESQSQTRDDRIGKAFITAAEFSKIFHDKTFVVGEANADRCKPGWSDFKRL